MWTCGESDTLAFRISNTTGACGLVATLIKCMACKVRNQNPKPEANDAKGVSLCLIAKPATKCST